jgi:hypothetical protein
MVRSLDASEAYRRERKDEKSDKAWVRMWRVLYSIFPKEGWQSKCLLKLKK